MVMILCWMELVVGLWTHAVPPLFYKELPETTTDDIEMRVCVDEAHLNENIAVEEIDIYMQ